MNNRPTPRVLVIDNELHVGDFLERAFIDEDFLCDRTSNGLEAAELLRNSEYDVVITDLSTPNLHAIALACDLFCDTTRHVIVALTDFPNDRLEANVTFPEVDFTECKPIDYVLFALRIREVLVCKTSLLAITEACQKFHGHDRLITSGEKHDELSAINHPRATAEGQATILLDSEVLDQVRQMICNPNSYLSDIANVIQKSPELTNDLLRMANSAHYNVGGINIERLEQAILRIGQRQLEEIVCQRFSLQESPTFIFDSDLVETHA